MLFCRKRWGIIEAIPRCALRIALNCAISQFDTDKKTDSEMADLAACIGSYRKIQILLDHFLAEYFKED